MKEMKRVYLDLWVPTVTEDKKSGRLKKKKITKKRRKDRKTYFRDPLTSPLPEQDGKRYQWFVCLLVLSQVLSYSPF